MNYTAFPLENQRNEAVRHALANKYMTDGTCGEISFDAPGGRTRIPMFPNHLKHGVHRHTYGRHAPAFRSAPDPALQKDRRRTRIHGIT